MEIVILLGAPGSGKGTLAVELAKVSGIRHLSSGDLLRAAVKDGTPAGMKAKTFMDTGNLVPDELIAEMIEDVVRADTKTQTLLLDGFPRNVPQAEILAGMMARVGVMLRCALLLDVPDDVVIRRISGRRVCPACGAGFNVDTLPPKQDGICDNCSAELIIRKDDKPETVQHRLEVYAAQTFPLIEYYRGAEKLVTIDGSSDDLAWKTQAALQKIRG
ncbi:MAG: adenylate kinase [Kiritimatiellae bacterium]|nr:adenylate kinase [Kiritimatiellia bacterium]